MIRMFEPRSRPAPRSPRTLAIAALLLLTQACASLRSSAPPSTETEAWTEPDDGPAKVRLTLVGTNDMHGWIEAHDRLSGEGEPVMGGADIFGGYLDILRRRRPGRVVLVDAGDVFQGTLVANLTEGRAVIKAYNALGYDAVAVGNHEFDYGPEGDSSVALTPADDPVGNLKKRIAEARFPFLVGNIFDRATQAPVRWNNTLRTTLVERGGVRVGIVGLTTPTTPSVTMAQNVAALDFAPLASTTVELAADLRSRGAQVVVLVLHAGTGCNLGSDPADIESCDRKGELFQLLQEIPEGTVDAAIAGHTHQMLAHRIHGVPAIQSGSFGTAFGMIELVYDLEKQELDRNATKIWQPVPLCRAWFAGTRDCRKETGTRTVPPVFMGRTVQPDLEVAEAVHADLRAVSRRKNEELGPRLQQPFTRSRVHESTLGSLVADIMRLSIPDATVAMTNSGGLRADLGVGPLTYGDVYQSLPFENRLAVLHLTGGELRALIERGVSGDHGIIQISGMRIEVAEPPESGCAEPDHRLLSVTLDNGEPLADRELYTVVTNDFVANGGDGYDLVLGNVDRARIKVRNDLPPLRESVVAHMRLNPELSGPVSGPARISFVKSPCQPQAAVGATTP